MFRNPRENRKLPTFSRIPPLVGRPPSPPPSQSSAIMAVKSASKTETPKTKSSNVQTDRTQTTLIPKSAGKKSPAGNGFKGKPKPVANGNIMAFFKKAEDLNSRLFIEERGAKSPIVLSAEDQEEAVWNDENSNVVMTDDAGHIEIEQRYNENGGSFKKRKVSEDGSISACTPPPPDNRNDEFLEESSTSAAGQATNARRKTGPFVDDSDSETEGIPLHTTRRNLPKIERSPVKLAPPPPSWIVTDSGVDEFKQAMAPQVPPPLKTEETSQMDGEDFDEYADIEDDEFLDGEEYVERRYMEEQRRLEMAEAGDIEHFDEFDAPPMFPGDIVGDNAQGSCTGATPRCPICEASLHGLSDQESSIHVNGCLDGNPVPLPESSVPRSSNTTPPNNHSKMFKRPPRPARTGQENPIQLGQLSAEPKSAFTRLMSSHAEDAAWATAAAAEHAARGKPAYERTCPFYKIMPGLYIAVDAFRYGAVKGQNAYFLSHFHSDHYVGLTASWCHGPIYCSRVTANLVRQQLRVDPKWVIDLEFEQRTEVPGTQGVHVTMIPANHCPGSSLFLFEKEVTKGKAPRLQRVLHCGDFRACRAHVEHPLLRPDVQDAVTGKDRQQKLDVCYLDTTYLNPKYAFPPQQQVIQACADMCTSLNKIRTDETDGWEQMKKDRAGEGMVKFVRKVSDLNGEKGDDEGEGVNDTKNVSPTKSRGRLLVVVGTYSIGKERICVGIAKALKSKIYASKGKTRICHALEDPELNALLTSDPREAQVHMTPLFEIRADTLDDYLREYSDHFSRAVGFRPSGWNYRPPNSRFLDSPAVQTVLHSQNWRSQFSMKDLTPQRGSTSRASCFGVPYSEHSSFRELTMFCCALRIDKIVPTVNVGSAKSRERMKAWCDRWAVDKKKNGLFKLNLDGSGW